MGFSGTYIMKGQKNTKNFKNDLYNDCSRKSVTGGNNDE